MLQIFFLTTYNQNDTIKKAKRECLLKVQESEE